MRLLVGVEAEIVAYHDMRHMSDAGLWNGWYDLGGSSACPASFLMDCSAAAGSVGRAV